VLTARFLSSFLHGSHRDACVAPRPLARVDAYTRPRRTPTHLPPRAQYCAPPPSNEQTNTHQQLKQPIPDDLVTILAKDEEKQKLIRDRSAADAASSSARLIGATVPAAAAKVAPVGAGNGAKVAGTGNGAKVAGGGGNGAKVAGTGNGAKIAPSASAPKIASAKAGVPASATLAGGVSKAAAAAAVPAKKAGMVIQPIPPFKGAGVGMGTGVIARDKAKVPAPAAAPPPPAANGKPKQPPPPPARLNVNASSFRPNPNAQAFTPTSPSVSASPLAATGPGAGAGAGPGPGKKEAQQQQQQQQQQVRFAVCCVCFSRGRALIGACGAGADERVLWRAADQEAAGACQGCVQSVCADEGRRGGVDQCVGSCAGPSAAGWVRC
jgi:hypothetical protein